MRRGLLVVALITLTTAAGRSDSGRSDSGRSDSGRSEDRPLHSAPLVQEVAAVGMTVSNMDRSVAFFSDVLTFEKVSDVEVAGDEQERLVGLFGIRTRVVRMRLGTEAI